MAKVAQGQNRFRKGQACLSVASLRSFLELLRAEMVSDAKIILSSAFKLFSFWSMSKKVVLAGSL